MKRISAQQARRDLPALVAAARYRDELALITVYGQAGAVLVSPDWYRSRKTDDDPNLPEDSTLRGENGRE